MTIFAANNGDRSIASAPAPCGGGPAPSDISNAIRASDSSADMRWEPARDLATITAQVLSAAQAQMKARMSLANELSPASNETAEATFSQTLARAAYTLQQDAAGDRASPVEIPAA